MFARNKTQRETASGGLKNVVDYKFALSCRESVESAALILFLATRRSKEGSPGTLVNAVALRRHGISGRLRQYVVHADGLLGKRGRLLEGEAWDVGVFEVEEAGLFVVGAAIRLRLPLQLGLASAEVSLRVLVQVVLAREGLLAYDAGEVLVARVNDVVAG